MVGRMDLMIADDSSEFMNLFLINDQIFSRGCVTC